MLHWYGVLEQHSREGMVGGKGLKVKMLVGERKGKKFEKKGNVRDERGGER